MTVTTTATTETDEWTSKPGYSRCSARFNAHKLDRMPWFRSGGRSRSRARFTHTSLIACPGFDRVAARALARASRTKARSHALVSIGWPLALSRALHAHKLDRMPWFRSGGRSRSRARFTHTSSIACPGFDRVAARALARASRTQARSHALVSIGWPLALSRSLHAHKLDRMPWFRSGGSQRRRQPHRQQQYQEPPASATSKHSYWDLERRQASTGIWERKDISSRARYSAFLFYD